MKKFKTLAIALACILALTLSLTSCDFLKYGFFDEEGNFVGLDNLFGNDNDENENDFEIQDGNQVIRPYTLNYISNGDGTCEVTVRINSISLMAVTKVEKIERTSADDYFVADKYFSGNNDVIVINPSEGVINGNDAVIINPLIADSLIFLTSQIFLEFLRKI